MGSLSFMSVSFLIAGALCALGPILIHLLNRRRHRTIQWAAMEFLRKAINKRRRVLNLRDWLLLAIRTLAVLLFGAALARPYFAREQQPIDASQPVHAIVIIDNSLSMAYETLEGSLLELAKRRALAFLERLPRGSRMTIVPACGSRDFLDVDALTSREQALDALGKIEIVDRSANMARVAELARLAAELSPELAQQAVLYTDQQKLNWQNVPAADLAVGQTPIQCITVRPSEWENTWIADVRVQDGLADVQTPATIVVEVAHQGSAPRRDLQVTLLAGDSVLGQQTITVEPGGLRREVSFECVLGGIGPAPAAGQVSFLPVTARISADRLPADDERSLSVPIVAALPVVFIDQVADEDENVLRNRLGESKHLRKLLAPLASRKDSPQQLIKVRHLTPEMVSREMLADSRLVVVAGVMEPGGVAKVLAEYVQQGGQLLLAAGADFDPAAWNDAGWLDGRGVLPVRLKNEPIGMTPDEAPERLRPFQLSLPSIADEPNFQLAGVPRGDLESLYGEPFFFKAVVVDESPESLAAIETAEVVRIEHEENREPDEARPAWLLWEDNAPEGQDGSAGAGQESTATIRKAYLPHVLARYDLPEKPPFLVSRQIGQGRVVFCSTGVLSPWNTLPKTNAVLLFDRLMRSMIEGTLPKFNIRPTDRMMLPLPRTEQHLAVSLDRPGAVGEEPLDVTFISADRRGVTASGLLTRGVYHLTGKRLSLAVPEPEQSAVWEVPIVVNGVAEESDLTPLSRNEFDRAYSTAAFHWIEKDEKLDLAGAVRSGQNTWWWLALVVLVLLGIEMAVIAGPNLMGSETALNDPRAAATTRALTSRLAVAETSARSREMSTP